MDVNDTKTVAPLSNLKRMIVHLAKMYEKFLSGEVEEDTYLLWQAKYLSFGTDAADLIYEAGNENKISVDKKIADAKKRFRKASLKD